MLPGSPYLVKKDNTQVCVANFTCQASPSHFSVACYVLLCDVHPLIVGQWSRQGIVTGIKSNLLSNHCLLLNWNASLNNRDTTTDYSTTRSQFLITFNLRLCILCSFMFVLCRWFLSHHNCISSNHDRKTTTLALKLRISVTTFNLKTAGEALVLAKTAQTRTPNVYDGNRLQVPKMHHDEALLHSFSMTIASKALSWWKETQVSHSIYVFTCCCMVF